MDKQLFHIAVKYGEELRLMVTAILGRERIEIFLFSISGSLNSCLLYTSDAADDLLCVDLGGRRIIKKTKIQFLSLVDTSK